MSFIDRVFVGESRELGVVQDRGYFGFGRTKKAALLAEHRGRPSFVIKSSEWFLLSGSTSYEFYTEDDARRLCDALSLYLDAVEKIREARLKNRGTY